MMSKVSAASLPRAPSAVSTILSQRSLTLSQISSVRSGLPRIPEINTKSNITNTGHGRSVKLQTLIINNWKEISKILQNNSHASSGTVVTASAVDQAIPYSDFIGIFNQYVIKNQDQRSIEPREALDTLYESSAE